MMYCSKCGSHNRDGVKYCMSCGNKLASTTTEPQIDSEQTYNYQNNEPVRTVDKYSNFNASTVKEIKDGKVSIIIGIISLIISPFLNILMSPLAIVGIIFGVNARKEGKAGIILNVISLVFAVAVLIIFGYILQDEFGLKDNYVGSYKCGGYYSEMSYDDFKYDVSLDLNRDKTFKMIYYNNATGDSIIKGTYEVEDNTGDSKSKKYSITMNATERNVQGQLKTEPYTTKYSYVAAAEHEDYVFLMNELSYTMYWCKKQ